MHTVSQLGRGVTLCQYDVAAAEVGEDCGEAIHGGSTKRRAWCVCVCVYAREVVEVVEE